MATTQKSRGTPKNKTVSFGLLANGSSGPWEIAIDEATSGTARWWMEIEGVTVSFSFEIPSLDIVGKMARFFESGSTKEIANGASTPSASLVIGKDKKTPIRLVRDDEYDDRVFLVVGPNDSPIVRYALAGPDMTQFVEALRQVQDDLQT